MGFITGRYGLGAYPFEYMTTWLLAASTTLNYFVPMIVETHVAHFSMFMSSVVGNFITSADMQKDSMKRRIANVVFHTVPLYYCTNMNTYHTDNQIPIHISLMYNLLLLVVWMMVPTIKGRKIGVDKFVTMYPPSMLIAGPLINIMFHINTHLMITAMMVLLVTEWIRTFICIIIDKHSGHQRFNLFTHVDYEIDLPIDIGPDVITSMLVLLGTLDISMVTTIVSFCFIQHVKMTLARKPTDLNRYASGFWCLLGAHLYCI